MKSLGIFFTFINVKKKHGSEEFKMEFPPELLERLGDLNEKCRKWIDDTH